MKSLPKSKRVRFPFQVLPPAVIHGQNKILTMKKTKAPKERARGEGANNLPKLKEKNRTLSSETSRYNVIYMFHFIFVSKIVILPTDCFVFPAI